MALFFLGVPGVLERSGRFKKQQLNREGAKDAKKEAQGSRLKAQKGKIIILFPILLSKRHSLVKFEQGVLVLLSLLYELAQQYSARLGVSRNDDSLLYVGLPEKIVPNAWV